jgi:hypothetical protein
MPNPADYKDKKSFLEACFSITKKEGLSPTQRQGTCLGMAREHFGGGDSNKPTKKE